ncbi:MAG: hypothetical protein ACYTGV_00295 [Planctomycetota bacterium]|jgi:hypothetical protein
MGWGLFLDPNAEEAEREVAWGALAERMHRPVLEELRRHIEGRRLVERLATDLCDELRDACEGLGGGEPRLRLRVAEEIRHLLHERGEEDDVGEEFDRDWASSLFLAALRDLRRSDPEAHRLILRAYDQGTEGGAPKNAEILAAKLGRPAESVLRDLEEGRTELRRLFELEIARTVADPSLESDERERLLPFAKEMFGD